jgi:hypothetical protein
MDTLNQGDAVRSPLTPGFAPSVLTAGACLLVLAASCGPESYVPMLDSAVGGRGGDTEGSGGALGGQGGAGGTAGSSDAGGPTIRFDFESTLNLDNWQAVGNEVPPDVQDQVQVSTSNAHHGASSLAMIYDGSYTPTASGNPYYGVYTAFNPPPPGATVTLWLLSTAPGVSVQVYAQTMPDYLWNGLAMTSPLVVNTWTKVTTVMPTAEAFYLGCLITSPLNISGAIYLDDISW